MLRAERLVRNQAFFRDVNEEIAAAVPRLGLPQGPDDRFTILCECGAVSCNQRIVLSEAEYESIRRIPTHFAVLRGHDVPDFERVVETNDRYIVVEKFGESAITAIKLDPRRRA